MTYECSSLALARKRRLAKLYVLLSASMSSTVVLVTSVLMVTGPAGLA